MLLQRAKYYAALALLVPAIAGIARAQDGGARVTGRVTAEDGSALAGATVQIRVLEIGAATNSSGAYAITVPAARARGQQVTVTARYIGYVPQSRTVTLSGVQTIDFRLVRDPLRLNQVVVTGVSTETDSRKVAFAVSKIDETTLQQVPALNPTAALVGKVAGARIITPTGTPGGETAVRLRASTSLSPGASQQPLLIIDGVITKGSLADVNVQDIESMEVLKGAASAGIYGSDAAAGVINIITRRGKNQTEGKTTTTFRNEVGMSGLARRLPINQSTNCYGRRTVNGVEDFPRSATGVVQCDSIGRFYDQPYPAGAAFRDQQDQIIGNGNFYTNYLSLGRRQGGTNLQLSVENQRVAGIIDVPGVDWGGFNRRTVRLNADQTVNEKFEVQAGAFFMSSDNQFIPSGTGGPFFGTLFMPPDVDLLANNRGADSTVPFNVLAGRLGATPSTAGNPLYNVLTNRQVEDRSRLQGNFRSKYRFTDWLTLEGVYGYDRSTNFFRNLTPKGTLTASGAPGNGSLSESNFLTTASNAQAFLTAVRSFGNLNAVGRISYLVEDEVNRFTRTRGSNQAAAGVLTLDNLLPSTLAATSFTTTLRARNAFGQLTLDWKDRYGADVMVRNDQSSLFGVDSRNRNFYRVAGFWRVSEDLKVPGVDEFKLRAARGTAGLRPPFAAQYETFSASGGLITPGVLGQRVLRPAFSTETEVGFNLDFLKRFSLEYTFANKLTTDQVLPVPQSAVVGFTSQWRNAGDLEGNTHEIALRASIIDRQGLNWQVGMTGDRTRQKVTRLAAPAFRTGAGPGAGVGGTLQSNDLFLVREGTTFGAMFGRRWVRSYEELAERRGFDRTANPESNYVVNPDGLLVLASTRGLATERAIGYVDGTGNSTVQIGDANPDFTMGFNSTLTWKNLSVFGLLDWWKGGDMYNLPRQWLMRSENRSVDMDQAGKPQDQKLATAYYNAINDANGFSTYFVEDGGFVRLRELSVNYTLNRGALARVGLDRFTDRVRVGVVGRNLWTRTNYTGLDPEASAPGTVGGTGSLTGAGDASTFRFDNFGYPNFRTFSFVLELGF